ncbi:MAG: response regulator transcription factor [Clostridiales bacterium]|nr:response regulator transcription factor [Clostridiales bacterium]
MRIAVCDDEEKYINDIAARIIKRLGENDLTLHTFSDGHELLDTADVKPYDLVFLDIEMPAMDGITLAKELRKKNSSTYIVFLTGHVEYAIEGYEVNALRYLTKPVQEDKLNDVLAYVIKEKQSRKQLVIKTDGEEIRIDAADIIYMEAQNKYVMIYTTKGEYLVRYNLADFEEELKDYGVMRVHRSYLVSLSKVRKIGSADCTMAKNYNVPVSRSNIKPLKDALLTYLEKESF